MVTWDDSNIEKSINSDNEQVNICLMAYIDKKVKVKTCSESNISSCSSSDNEKDMSYDVLLQNSHMISL